MMMAIPNRNPTLYERRDNAIYGAILTVVVFQNLYNPVSPYLTLAVNIATVACLMITGQRIRVARAPIVVTSVYIVLAWLLLVTIFRGGADTQVLLKYFRSACAITLFVLIFGSHRFPASSVVKAINFTLGFHVVMVGLQTIYPNVVFITAPLFGFARESSVLEEYTLRKLGASSSYDTASYFSIAALVFFYFQFAQGRGYSYLAMAAAAFLATLMSSRLGIMASILIVTFLFISHIQKSGPIGRIIISLCLLAFATACFSLVYPLFLHSVGIAELQPDETGVFFSNTDYGTRGSLDALTNDHLKPLERPIPDLIIGIATEPNANNAAGDSDIGYVKLIYHVGIIGTLIIVGIHLYMLLTVRAIARSAGVNVDDALIARYLFVLIAFALLWNYKSLEIHSRGAGDFIYLLFIFLASRRATHDGLVKRAPRVLRVSS